VAVPQRQLLETIKTQCDQLEERFPGYRKAVFEKLAEIVSLEKGNTKTPTYIVQKIGDQCEALGDLLKLKTRS